MILQSGSAVLDVIRGRRSLERAVRRGERVPVTIRGFIDQVGNDDGMSTEFTVEVTEASVMV